MTHGTTSKRGWHAVPVQTGSGIETRWLNPWRNPDDVPNKDVRLLLYYPTSAEDGRWLSYDVVPGEYDGRWLNYEGAYIDTPKLWCYAPELP